MATHLGVCVALAFSVVAGCSGGDSDLADGGQSVTCGDVSECAPDLCINAVCLDGSDDDDGDGLSNAVEVAIGTDPLNLDSDGDALVDSFEVGDINNPTDTDGDGVIDALESESADADCDNISDQQDPDSATAFGEASGSERPEVCLLDGDEDGIPDLQDCEPNDPNVGASCPEAAACFQNICQAGVGCVSEAIVCDDDNGCTVDSCNQSTGECVFGLIACDDDPCTDDVCDPATGACLTSLKDCEDDIPCTTDEHCEAGTGECVATYKDCSDDNPCTDDVCLPNSGICQAIDVVCDDLNACTFDQCDPLNGECLFQAGKCDDGSACTIDSCDPLTGDCSYETPDCDDANACTTDFCDPETGGCIHEAKFCDDESLCTETVCDPETGWCDHPEIDCNDFNACTLDSCDLETGECVYEIVECVDVLACTEDTCVESVGCVFVPEPCDDGNPCTEGVCSEDDAGLCVYTDITCDDGNPCTNDVCNPEFDGACSYEPLACDDGNPCTVDSCDNNTGACTHDPLEPTSVSFGAADDMTSGIALWNSTEGALEAPATGHNVPACGGVTAPYYLASTDYGELQGEAVGAAIGTEASGLDTLVTHLEALGMTVADLHLKLSLAHLGADAPEVDWTFDAETNIETRIYHDANIEVWLEDKPLIASTLGTLNAEIDHSDCGQALPPVTLRSGLSYAVDLTSGTNFNDDTKLAAQLLLQGLGVPAKVSLELTLAMDMIESLNAAGRNGIIVPNPSAMLLGESCETPE